MRRVVVFVTLVLVASGCAVATPSASVEQPTTNAYDEVGGTVLVFAASSLTNAFAELGAAFEQINPEIDIELNFGASSTLREQILDGAPADVFAAASDSVMAALIAQEDSFAAPVTFASNQLVLAAPASSERRAAGLGALEDPALFVGLCAPDVPCGKLAETALRERGIEPDVDTYEPNARALTNRLVDAELDLGLIYQTDANATQGELVIVDVLSEPANHYPAASRTRAGQLFVDYLTSEAGQSILASWGFGTP